MAEIMEVLEDMKKGLGDKGFYLLIGGAVLFGLYNLTKGQQSPVSTVTVSATYPDIDTNADVVIDTIQDSIEYSEGIILDALENQDSVIQDMGDDIKKELANNFTATNNYINKGFESQNKLIQTGFNELQTDMDKAQAQHQTIIKNQETTQKAVKSISKDTKSSSGSSGSSKKSGNNGFYKYKTKKGLNTSTSIVDALKAIGVNSSMSFRKKIAKANGIKNYSGTASQNISLLNKLKAGKLKKV